MDNTIPVPVGDMTVPAMDPNWGYQLGQKSHKSGELRVCCLLQGMEAVSAKVVDFDKLVKIKQQADENHAIFLHQL